MSNKRCYITGLPCSLSDGGFESHPDGCEIGRYMDSSRYYAPGESKSGANKVFDSTCRYYGIARAAKLQKQQLFFEQDKSYIGREY